MSFSDIVDVINETTGRKVTLDIVSDEEYVEKNGPGDEGGKPLVSTSDACKSDL